MGFREIYNNSKDTHNIISPENLTSNELYNLINESEEILFLTRAIGKRIAIETNDKYIGFVKNINNKPIYIIIKIEKNNVSINLWLETAKKIKENKQIPVWENITLERSSGNIWERKGSIKKMMYLSEILEKVVIQHNKVTDSKNWKEDVKNYSNNPNMVKALLIELRNPDIINYYENFYLPMQNIINKIKKKKETLQI